MADAWGGSWGTSWGVSWGTGGTPPVVVTNRGDDAVRRGTRPIVSVRPKIERDLDDILELVETVSETRRVTENKETIKSAVAAIKEITPPPNYKKPIAAIQKALAKVSRSAAKHEGLKQAMLRISLDLETLIVELERKRKRRQKDEEALAWLLG